MDKRIAKEFLCSTHHCTDGKQSPDKANDLSKAFQPYHSWGEPASWPPPCPQPRALSTALQGKEGAGLTQGRSCLLPAWGSPLPTAHPHPHEQQGSQGHRGQTFCCKNKAHRHLRPGVMIRIPPSAHQPFPSLQGTWDASPHSVPGNLCWSWNTSWVFPSLRRLGVCAGLSMHCLNEFPQPCVCVTSGYLLNLAFEGLHSERSLTASSEDM